MLRKITRDCLCSVSVALADSMDNVIEGNEDDDGKGHKYNEDDGDDNDDDSYEECEEGISDEELDEGAMEDNDGDRYGDSDQFDYDDVSF